VYVPTYVHAMRACSRAQCVHVVGLLVEEKKKEFLWTQ
jgi:hypothetical protein